MIRVLPKLSLVTLLVVLSSMAIQAAPDAQSGGADKANAAKKNQTSPAQTLEETVVVTATRTERYASDVPVSMTVVRRVQAEEAPVTQIDDLLKNTPSVMLPLTSSTIQFPTNGVASMRGIGGSSAAVLVDGVPATDGYRVITQWNKIPIRSISQVEIVRGGGSNLFGNYALGGTINIITRAPSASGLSASATYGTHQTYRAGVSVDQVFSDRFSLSLDYDLFDTDGFQRNLPEARGPIDIPAASRSDNSRLRADYQISTLTRGTAKVNYLEHRLSLGTPIGRADRDILDLSNTIHRGVGASGNLTFTMFMQDQQFYQDNVVLTGNRSGEWLLNSSVIQVDDLGGSLQWATSFSKRVPYFTLGIDARDVEGSEALDNFTPTGAVRSKGLSGGRQKSYGIFAQTSWQPSERVEILAGARFDYWKSWDGFEGTVGGTITQFPEKDSSAFDPRVSFRYEIDPNLIFRSSVYRAFRGPLIRDMYRSGRQRTFQALPNPDLEPEILTGGEIGIVRTGANWIIESNVYYNVVTDAVLAVPVALVPIYTFRPENIGETKSRGLEVMGDYRFSRSWSLDASYVYTDAWVSDNPVQRELEGNAIEGIPEHVGTFGIRYRRDNGFVVSLRGRSQTKTYRDASNAQALDSATLFDLYTSYPIGSRTEIFVMGHNIFDERYLAEITVDPRYGAPREFHSGVKLHLPW